jgi:hypothetical protein
MVRSTRARSATETSPRRPVFGGWLYWTFPRVRARAREGVNYSVVAIALGFGGDVSAIIAKVSTGPGSKSQLRLAGARSTASDTLQHLTDTAGKVIFRNHASDTCHCWQGICPGSVK